MLYNTAAGTVTQDALDANKDKKIFWFYFASCYIRNYFSEVNYKNFDLSVDGYGTSSKSVQW
jgi:hypothetical protein